MKTEQLESLVSKSERLNYFVGNANGRGLIRIEVEGTGEHIASLTRSKRNEAWAHRIVQAVNATSQPTPHL